MLGARRAIGIVASFVAVLIAASATGCGTAGHVEAPSHLVPVSPAAAPPPGQAPAGTVWPLDGSATAMAFDQGGRTLVIALSDPPRLLLGRLDGGAGLDGEGGLDGAGGVLRPRRGVPLPAPASDLTVVPTDGTVLVPVPDARMVLPVPVRVPTAIAGGAPGSATTPATSPGAEQVVVDGAPQSAIMVDGYLVVALGDRIAIFDGAAVDGAAVDGVGSGGRMPRTVPGFVDAVRLVPFGTKVVVLDRGRAALSLVEPAAGQAGPALRGGLGLAAAVTDRYDRILMTDVHQDEFLVFAGDPLLLRQRFPLAGAPYGLAYDDRRDLAWVTLTARNEVVGLDVTGGEPTIVHRFPTVHQPDAVAVDPASGRVMVASGSGAGLQVIDPERVVH